jgi:membrane fusion protein, multidrug efflux system
MNRRNNNCVGYGLCRINPWAGLAGMALVVVSVLSSGCGAQQAADSAQPAGGGARGGGRGRGGGAPVPVVAGKAVLKDMPIDVTAIGTVEAYTSVSVRAQVTGPLLEAHFKEGDFVRKGQLLFEVDPRPYETDLARTKAALERDKALAENNRSQAERYKKLLAEGVVAAQQVDSFLSAADASDATVTSDEAAIRQSQLNLDYCTIEAPLDGYTGKIMVEPGNLVRASDAALVVVNQINPIYVSFAVPQQNLGDIKKFMGQGKLAVTATLPNDTGPAEKGALTFVDNAVDPSTGTIRLRAMFDNERKRLWPGLFVNTMLRLSDRPNTLVVPSQAISTNQNGQFVYVVKADSTVESRPVIAGAAIEGESIIQQGLKAGETVVIDGQLRLIPGAKAEITNRAADDSPTPPGGGGAPAAPNGAAGAGTGQGRGQARGQGRGQGRRGAGQGQGQQETKQ